MRRFTPVYAAIMLSLISAVAIASPPKVVKAVPDNGATDIDAGIKELRVTFDQPMNTNGMSIVGGGDSFPGSGARAHWVDATTCVLPIALKPGHSYWVSINSDRFQGFCNKQGEAAEPYPISFTTGSATTKPALTAAQNDAAIAKLRAAINDDYSYLDVHKVDWDQAFAAATPGLEAAQTTQQFAVLAGKVLAAANDMHIWLSVDQLTFPAAIRRVDPNCHIPTIMQLVPNRRVNNSSVLIGKYDDGIGYVMIRNFTGDASMLAPAMDALKDCTALIVDVRLNSGGDEMLAQKFAGCFVTSPQVYARDIVHQNGQDSPVYDRVLNPNTDQAAFDGKVALLIGPENMSSCESFILMMKTNPNCTTIGTKTYGSSGNPKPHDLGNGVTLMLPSWRDLRLDGTCIEGVGIAPDVAVDGGANGPGDPVLDKALAVLRGQ